MRSRQRHLCQPIQPCSPTSLKASPYSLLRKLNTRYTYSQNWTPCSSRYLWPRVGGAKGDVPEVGGGGQRRPDHPDQVARHHRHQRLPQRWQLQGEQEALRDGSVRGRRHLRTNQVFIAHNYWSSVACQMCFQLSSSGQLLQAMCKPCRTHWMCHLCRPSEKNTIISIIIITIHPDQVSKRSLESWTLLQQKYYQHQDHQTTMNKKHHPTKTNKIIST